MLLFDCCSPLPTRFTSGLRLLLCTDFSIAAISHSQHLIPVVWIDTPGLLLFRLLSALRLQHSYFVCKHRSQSRVILHRAYLVSQTLLFPSKRHEALQSFYRLIPSRFTFTDDLRARAKPSTSLFDRPFRLRSSDRSESRGKDSTYTPDSSPSRLASQLGSQQLVVTLHSLVLSLFRSKLSVEALSNSSISRFHGSFCIAHEIGT